MRLALLLAGFSYVIAALVPGGKPERKKENSISVASYNRRHTLRSRQY
jgi:hypothetical protein